MTELLVPISPALDSWVQTRLAQGEYVDAADYIRDLLRRDQARSHDDSWVRAMLDEGRASGVIDREPEDVLDEIMAEDPELRG